MDQGPGNSEERGRLGRQGDTGRSDADRGDADGDGFRDRGSSGREHPPEQYPGGRRSEEPRSSEPRDSDSRGFDQRDSSRQPYPSGHSQQEARSGGTGWGIAALVLGVLALLGSLFGLFNIILAIPALILGIVARRKGSKGLGLTAIILAILAVLLGIVLTVLAGIVFSSPEFQQLLQEAQQ